MHINGWLLANVAAYSCCMQLLHAAVAYILCIYAVHMYCAAQRTVPVHHGDPDGGDSSVDVEREQLVPDGLQGLVHRGRPPLRQHGAAIVQTAQHTWATV